MNLAVLLLPCRRRVEDLWTLMTAPGDAEAELAAHAVSCRYCAPQMERLGLLIEATAAMRQLPPPRAPDGFLDRVMSVVATELRTGPDIRLLPEPARAVVSTSAVLAVVRQSLSVLTELGDEFRLRRSKVSESPGSESPAGGVGRPEGGVTSGTSTPTVDLVLSVDLAQDCDEGEWRRLVVSAVSLAIDAEIGLAVGDVDLQITLVPRRDGTG